jgi:O-antigen/teichoic acid export membrane protein
MARESIVALSLMAMGSSVCLLLGVVLLGVVKGDSLVRYAGAYAVSQAVFLLAPMLYCVFRFPECRHVSSAGLRWKNLKELLGFSGWSLIGNFAGQLRNQGPAILLNRFVGTMANAAYGIAIQVNAFATNISGGMLRAVSPAVVKIEASGDRRAMLSLSNDSNKYAFLLLWLALGPVLCDLRYCLRLWLHQAPPAAAETFTLLLLIALLIDQLTAGFMASVQAEGRIALYQGVVALPICVSFCTGYLLLRLNLPASSVLWAGVGGSAVANAGRLVFVCRRLGFDAGRWLNTVFLPCALICTICSFVLVVSAHSFGPGPLSLLGLYMLNTALVVLLSWRVASRPEERDACMGYVLFIRGKLSQGSRSVMSAAARRLAWLRSREAAQH